MKKKFDKLLEEYDFSLESVTWGYRDIFYRIIAELFEQGFLGDNNTKNVTDKFFEILKKSDKSCFDHVIKKFLESLNPSNRWILTLPNLFAELIDFASELAEKKLYYGIKFFEVLSEGGMGNSPQQLKNCLSLARTLYSTDEDLVIAFLSNYKYLNTRMTFNELSLYIQTAITIYRKNKDSACSFLKCELSSSEKYIQTITSECRLCDISERLGNLLSALTCIPFEVNNLGELDSDELIERGSQVVAVHGHIYLPASCRSFEEKRMNENYYLLCVTVNAAMFLTRSFACIHGYKGFGTCKTLTGSDIYYTNLFLSMEYARVLMSVGKLWKGACNLIRFGIENEFKRLADSGSPEGFLYALIKDSPEKSLIKKIRLLLADCASFYDTLNIVNSLSKEEILKEFPSILVRPLLPVSFLSDFLFPVEISKPPPEALMGDLKGAVRKTNKKKQSSHEQENSEGEDKSLQTGSYDSSDEISEEKDNNIQAAFVYKEWDFIHNDYREGWCMVYERRNFGNIGKNLSSYKKWFEHAERIRKLFEKLKPEITHKEKYLADGDEINIDLLLNYLVETNASADVPVRFYEKPLVNRRDLAALILLDLSGSTGERLPGEKDGMQAKAYSYRRSVEPGMNMLDVEKHMAVILGAGLAALDDTYAICGFSSDGREKCEYFIFKDFEQKWSDKVIEKIISVAPGSSTRIGVALRHSGYLLSSQPHKQRLIILVTDGKPMDKDYDPTIRYAQHDVRMACEENKKADIHTFAISTDENSVADMELMFPKRNFIILPDIRQLPAIIPKLYLKLTMR